MSTISAGTTSGTALVSAGNTDGTIQLRVNGTTPSVTLATTGAIGVGSTPAYGTSGQALISGGSGAAPSWGAAGALTYLSVVNASAATTVSVETGFSTTYDNYMLVLSNVSIDGGAFTSTDLLARLKLGGTYQTANYLYSQAYFANTSLTSAGSTSASSIQLVPSAMATTVNVASNTLSGVIHIFGPTNSAKRRGIYYDLTTTQQNGSAFWRISGGGANSSTSDMSGIQFFATSSYTITGTFRLYGISNS
jgi:hypothetical protein